MYRSPLPSDFRCGRYTAAWNPARKVHDKARSYRFEITGAGPAHNTNDPSEALRIARLYASVGASVSVRDRSRRRGYLTEIELQELSNAQGT